MMYTIYVYIYNDICTYNINIRYIYIFDIMYIHIYIYITYPIEISIEGNIVTTDRQLWPAVGGISFPCQGRRHATMEHGHDATVWVDGVFWVEIGRAFGSYPS